MTRSRIESEIVLRQRSLLMCLFELLYSILKGDKLHKQRRLQHVDQVGQVLLIGRISRIMTQVLLDMLQKLQGSVGVWNEQRSGNI